MSDAPEPDVIIRREGAAGVIRLNRPKAINALTLDMTRVIATALDQFEADDAVQVVILEGAGERGLCAGGDIRGLYDSAKSGGDLGPVFWREEYIVNSRIASYLKPYVAYMDGIVMGGGVGLAAHGNLRVVNERTALGMPEVGIGFFPDVGGTWLLSRAPGEIGTYFGLTGKTMNGADALAAEFADVFIPSVQWPAAREALTRLKSSEDVRAILTKFSADAGEAPVAQHRGEIDRLFGFDSVAEVFAALQAEATEFAHDTLQALKTKSPTSMIVTLKLLRDAQHLVSLEECLTREYRAALTVFDSAEFVEGVRAAVIDKDRNPKWSPSRIEDVTDEIVAGYFRPRGADELCFPDTETVKQASKA